MHKRNLSLKAGEKLKEVVILRATNKLGDNRIQDAVIPIVIEAFAVDDPNIKVDRKTEFIYPRESMLNKN